MKKEIISIDQAPKAIGPYSQGVEVSANTITYFSGQIAIDPKTQKLIDGDVAAQTRQIFENISALLHSRKMTFDNVVKSTVFITDISAFAKVNEIYAAYFSSQPPARSCVEVKGLPAGALVEVEIIACK